MSLYQLIIKEQQVVKMLHVFAAFKCRQNLFHLNSATASWNMCKLVWIYNAEVHVAFCLLCLGFQGSEWLGQVSYLGFEEADGDAVVLQTVDSQFAAAGRRQRLSGDELQQTNQNDSGLQLRVNVSQLHLVLQQVKTVKDWQLIFYSDVQSGPKTSISTPEICQTVL